VRYSRFGVVFLFLFLSDFLTKQLAQRTLTFFDEVSVLPPVLFFNLVHNYGAAYGIFQYQRVFLISITLLVFVFALNLFFSADSSSRMRWGIVVLLSGAVGNFSDRVVYGYVIDFIDIRILPVFNIADMLINVGIVLIVLSQFKFGRR